MGKSSSIEWTHHTFNPWWGCTKISPGCEHCYADTFATRVGHGKRLPMIWGPRAERKIASESMWAQPLKWNRAAQKAGERHRVFCASMADVFEDRPDLVIPRRRLRALIHQTPHLDWLLLTKRPENAHRLMQHAALAFWDGVGPTAVWPANVWLGTTVEDQAHAEKRIPHLLAAPAKVHFVSYEPALGPVDFNFAIHYGHHTKLHSHSEPAIAGIDWIIVGGESGGGARPFEIGWARSVIAQGKTAGCWVFVKQLGRKPIMPMADVEFNRFRGWADGVKGVDLEHSALDRPTYAQMHDAAGGDMAEWPADLRVREIPHAVHHADGDDFVVDLHTVAP